MSNAEGVNKSRRVLLGTTVAIGSLGAIAAVVPFVRNWDPNLNSKAKAAGAPVTQDITQVEPGQMIVVEWRQKPVYIVHRDKKMLDNLSKNDPNLSDPKSDQSVQPDFAKNPTRSKVPEFLVVMGVCTHLGCAPGYRPEVGAADLGSNSYGGFYCPCHGSKYDLAGRVYKGQPAPANLEVPPYKLQDGILTVGES